jgi:hypothetical protein
MTQLSDEDARLAALLRAIAAPEPSADFLAGASRRYARAMQARSRREALAGLGLSALGLVVVTVLLLSAFEPVTLIAWVVVSAAEVMAWMEGVASALSVVPPALWAPALLGLVVASLLPLAFLLRPRSLLVVK